MNATAENERRATSDECQGGRACESSSRSTVYAIADEITNSRRAAIIDRQLRAAGNDPSTMSATVSAAAADSVLRQRAVPPVWPAASIPMPRTTATD